MDQSQIDQSEEIERRIGGLTVCPRCGMLGWAYVSDRGGRQYVYVLHKVKRPGGKTRVKHCYLGPVDAYRHTYVTNEIPMKGLIDPYRYIKYLRMVLAKIAEFASIENVEERKRIAQQLREAQKMLDNIIKLFESRQTQTE